MLPYEMSKVQWVLNKLKSESKEKEMVINNSKCNVMLFNESKSYDFMPNIEINNTQLQVVEQMRLLGLILTPDLSWKANSDYICKRAYARLWMLRRLKQFGVGEADLIDVYCKQVRSVLEFAVPVWSSGLTEKESNQIERVQKCGLAIILGHSSESYESLAKSVGLSLLSERRTTICINFASKSFKMTNTNTGLKEETQAVLNMISVIREHYLNQF